MTPQQLDLLLSLMQALIDYNQLGKGIESTTRLASYVDHYFQQLLTTIGGNDVQSPNPGNGCPVCGHSHIAAGAVPGPQVPRFSLSQSARRAIGLADTLPACLAGLGTPDRKPPGSA